MMDNSNDDIFVFKKFYSDEDPDQMEMYCHAAIDKLQTLFPGKKITRYDNVTLGIETDSLYSETGIDIYELGLVDNEVPAMRKTRDEEILTFRI